MRGHGGRQVVVLELDGLLLRVQNVNLLSLDKRFRKTHKGDQFPHTSFQDSCSWPNPVLENRTHYKRSTARLG